MSLTNYIALSVKLIFCIITFLATFYTAIDLILFLSDLNYKIKIPLRDDITSWSLFTNMCLLSLFIMQHSLLTQSNFKIFCKVHSLQDLQRTIYVFSTILVLQILMKNWSFIPNILIWQLKATNLYWWTCVCVHVIGWLFIYVGIICMDVNELLGIKQVYYSVKNLPDPCIKKSFELRKLYSHVRHPGLIAFLLIFWTRPVMSLDRFLLAIILSLYMLIAWRTDRSDYYYQKAQYDKKFHMLTN